MKSTAWSLVLVILVAVGAATIGPPGTVQATEDSALAPVINSLSPAFGPEGETTTVILTGDGFTEDSTVSFGEAVVSSALSNDSLTFDVPGDQAAGEYAIVVTNPGQTPSDPRTFRVVGAPTVAAISPTAGPLAGGTEITVTGTGFTAGDVTLVTGVTVGGIAATGISITSATTLTATVPAATASGAAEVLVQSEVAGKSFASVSGVNFNYSPAPRPTVDSLSPSSGPTSASLNVVVAGSGFFAGGSASSVQKVTVGGQAATSVTVASDTQLTATFPSGLSGENPVVVTTEGGESDGDVSFRYFNTGVFRTTDYGTAPIQGGAFIWRGYAIRMAEDTVVTGMIGGGTKGFVAGQEAFHGAIFAAGGGNSDTPGNPSSVLVEVRFGGATVNQEVNFANPTQGNPGHAVLVSSGLNSDKQLILEKDHWYFIMQGRERGSVLHWYVDSLTVEDLIAASARVSDWLPNNPAVTGGQAFIGASGGSASGNLRSLSLTPAKPAVGLVYESKASGPPQVTTLEEPLQGRLTSTGGGATALYIEYGTGLTALQGESCTSTADPGTGIYPAGCRISTGLALNLAEPGYSGSVPYDFGATLSGLNAGQKYFYRARAINDAGRVDGPIRSFTTPGPPGVPIISQATGANQSIQLNVDPAPSVVTDTGVVTVGATTNYQYSVQVRLPEQTEPDDSAWGSWISAVPASLSNPVIVRGLINDQEYWVRIRALGSGVIGGVSLAVSAIPTAEPPPIVSPPPPAPPAPTTTSSPPTVAVTPVPPPVVPQATAVLRPRVVEPGPLQSGPVLRNNVAPTPPPAPTAIVGGAPTTVQSTVQSPTNLALRVDRLNLGISVQPDQGLIRQAPGGQTEVQVRSGTSATLQGSGVAPRSVVQVFMPLQGDNAKEITRIQADAAGNFNGEALFATGLRDAPIPIGRQVLQMVTVDEEGRQAVVELTVNIAQPPPSPEIDREAGDTPALLPGQSLATNAGVPIPVKVIALPDDKQTRIEGDGWSMAVDVNNPNAAVEETEDGGVLLKLVRDETAQVSGSGFMPLTRADIWLFSEPTLVGTVDIDENGEFNGEVNVDGRVVTVGEHTLQLQGVGTDGYVRAANLGVLVGDEAPEVVTTAEQAGGFFWWLVLIALVVIGAIVALFAWLRRKGLAEA